MSVFLVLLAVVVAYWYWKLRSGASTAPRSSTGATAPKARAAAQPDWLAARWAMAERHGGPGGIFPAWYFDPMTEHQANRLRDDGKRLSSGATKGQASDVIGMSEPADDDDLEVLRHFKSKTGGMNQTRARHEVQVLFQSEANKQSWESRPPSARTKEFYRFLGVKLAAGVSHSEALQLIRSKYEERKGAGDPVAVRWDAYETVLDEFDDPEFRTDNDLKKPSYGQIRAALESLEAEAKAEAVVDGKPKSDLEVWADVCDDVDQVAEKLRDLYPNLEK